MLEMIKDKERLLQRDKNKNRQRDWELARIARNKTNFQAHCVKVYFVEDNLNLHQQFWQNIKEVLLNSRNKQSSNISHTDNTTFMW